MICYLAGLQSVRAKYSLKSFAISRSASPLYRTVFGAKEVLTPPRQQLSMMQTQHCLQQHTRLSLRAPASAAVRRWQPPPQHRQGPLASTAAAGSSDAAAADNSSSVEASVQGPAGSAPWQQSIARTAVLGVSAAALGLALMQGRAHAASSTRPAPQAAITTQHIRAPPVAAITPLVLDHQHNSTKEAFQYRVMQLFAAPVYGKLLAVFAIAAPILALGSLLYHKAVPGSTWAESCLKPYGVLLNCPGGQRQPAAAPSFHSSRTRLGRQLPGLEQQPRHLT